MQKIFAQEILNSRGRWTGTSSFVQHSFHRHIADLTGNPDPVLPAPAFDVISGVSTAGDEGVHDSVFKKAMCVDAKVYHHYHNWSSRSIMGKTSPIDQINPGCKRDQSKGSGSPHGEPPTPKGYLAWCLGVQHRADQNCLPPLRAKYNQLE
ncbi:Beta-enolase [Galemys pyrenaicus]|uniref:Beta-enolase n=1 Tax=Galemys pyrenaicus TaxID=202257 RepID=A0A8J6DRW0_GALPY|nr:Beta-enolase [Galemys pyrenaicus]